MQNLCLLSLVRPAKSCVLGQNEKGMIVEFVSTRLPAFYNLLPRMGYDLTGGIGTMAIIGISSFSVLPWDHQPQGKGVLFLCICCLLVMRGLTGRFDFLERGCWQLSTTLSVVGWGSGE